MSVYKKLKIKLKKLCLDVFESRKQNLISSFDEQLVRDHGFSAFKQRLTEFENQYQLLISDQLCCESSTKLFETLRKSLKNLDEIKSSSMKFIKAITTVHDLNIKVDWKVSDEQFLVQFPRSDSEIEIHEKMQSAFKTDPRKKMLELSFEEGEFKEKTKNGGENKSSSMIPQGKRYESQITTKINAKNSFAPEIKNSLFSTGELDECRIYQANIHKTSQSEQFFPQSDIILDEWEIPGGKYVQTPSVKSYVFPENYEPFVKKQNEAPSYQKTVTKVKNEGILIKPGPSKTYVSSRKVQVHDPQPFPSSVRNVDHNSLNAIDPQNGIISNQAIDESKFKLIINELKTTHRYFKRIEFHNNTFKCNYIKVLRTMITERLICEVWIDENKNKMQTKSNWTKKELQQLKDMNITVSPSGY